MKIKLDPIGIIRTPFKERQGMPSQPAEANGAQGSIQIDKKYRAGLEGLENFSHIVVLFYLHRSKGYRLKLTPRGGIETRGVFATRAPKRPNGIGLSVLRLEKIENGTLYVQNVDMLDNTPILDIKPHIAKFDGEADA